MKAVYFTSKMIRKFVTGSRKVIIGTDYRGDYHVGNLPKRKEILYVAEPFRRRFGMKDGLQVEDHVQYKADNELLQINKTEYLTDTYTKWLPANAMLEHEARFFVEVEYVQHRIFQSLKLSEIIHDGSYDLAKTNRVWLLTFSSVSKEYVQKLEEQKNKLSFWEDID